MTDRINYRAPKPSFDIGRVMNRAFAGVFKNIKPILLAIVIVVLISGIASTPMFFLDNAAPEGPLYLTATIVTSAVWFLSGMFMCVFTDHLAFAKFTNRPAGFRYVFLRSLKLSIPILFIVILYFIASYIGMIFLIVPGVIISVGWAVIGPAYLHEETSLFGSFGRSWSLTRGYKWWVWLATIIMSAIATLMLVVISILISALTAVRLPVAGDPSNMSTDGFVAIAITSAILMYLSIYLFAALYASFTTAIYTELRELKEGPLAEEMSVIFD